MEDMYGIKYSKPEVVLLQDTGIGVAEAAARTCYDSFENSENEVITRFMKNGSSIEEELDEYDFVPVLDGVQK